MLAPNILEGRGRGFALGPDLTSVHELKAPVIDHASAHHVRDDDYEREPGLFHYEESHPYGTVAYRAMDSAVDVSVRRYRYTGMEQDEETGLGYHTARFYAPWLGRWTASDPIGLGGGVNRFGYCGGRPTVVGDPGGMDPKRVQRATQEYASANAEFTRAVASGDVASITAASERLTSATEILSSAVNSEAQRREQRSFAQSMHEKKGEMIDARPVGSTVSTSGPTLSDDIAGALGTVESRSRAGMETTAIVSMAVTAAIVATAVAVEVGAVALIEQGAAQVATKAPALYSRAGVALLNAQEAVASVGTTFAESLVAQGVPVRLAAVGGVAVEVGVEVSLGDLYFSKRAPGTGGKSRGSASTGTGGSSRGGGHGSVRPGDTGQYRDLKVRRAESGQTEPLHMDHQPSYAAQRAAAERELGRALTPAEARALRESTPAVASPVAVHRESSTYGGRNTPAQIAQDSADLAAAQARDRAEFDEAMRRR